MTITEQEITEFLLAIPGRLAIAQEVQRATEAVKRRLIAAFLHEIASAAEGELGEPGLTKWLVTWVQEDDPELMNKHCGLVTIRNPEWPAGVEIGLQSGRPDCQEIYSDVWSDPNSATRLSPEKWHALQGAFGPFGALRDQTPKEWCPVRIRLDEHGFSGSFTEQNILELARQIVRNEAPEGNEATRIGGWLVRMARKTDEVLRA